VHKRCYKQFLSQSHITHLKSRIPEKSGSPLRSDQHSRQKMSPSSRPAGMKSSKISQASNIISSNAFLEAASDYVILDKFHLKTVQIVIPAKAGIYKKQ